MFLEQLNPLRTFVRIPSLPNTLWVGLWTPNHFMRRPFCGSKHLLRSYLEDFGWLGYSRDHDWSSMVKVFQQKEQMLKEMLHQGKKKQHLFLPRNNGFFTLWKITMEPNVMEVCVRWLFFSAEWLFRFQPLDFTGKITLWQNILAMLLYLDNNYGLSNYTILYLWQTYGFLFAYPWKPVIHCHPALPRLNRGPWSLTPVKPTDPKRCLGRCPRPRWRRPTVFFDASRSVFCCPLPSMKLTA